MAIRLPYNDRAEAQVLGCLLRDDKVFWQISEVLEPDDFHVSDYQAIYRICIELLNRRRPINAVTVADALAVAKDIKVTVEDLDALADDVISPRSIGEYARQVAGHAQVRSVMRAMMDAQEMLSNLDATADREAAIIDAEGMIFQASKRRARNSGVTLDQAIGDVLQDMDTASRTDISERGFSWGLPEADDIAGRLIPGWMYLLAGAAGSGKTALAAQALESIAMKGPVVAYSHEMAPHDHATRTLAKESHVSAERIQNYTASPREIESLERIKDEFLIRNRNIIIEPGRKTIFQIKAHAMRIKHSRGLLAIAIDHARLVLPSDSKMKDHEQAGEVSLEAKEIAKDLGIPVILLAQLKQAELAGRANNRPRESDVYGGGAPVQNCDTILMVHRQALYHQARKPPSNASAADIQKWEDEAERTKGAAELITGKRRSGRGHQSREVYFDGPRTRFQSWTEKMRAENTSANMTATDYDDAERLV